MKYWFCCFQLLRILCLRKDEIKHGKIFETIDEFFAILGDLRGEFIQDSSFLVAFLQLQFTHGIVQFDNWQWLHEESCSARGLIMNDSFDLSFELRPQRNDITSIALCDDRFL